MGQGIAVVTMAQSLTPRRARPKRRNRLGLLALGTFLCAQGCVISTYEGTGVAPTVPLPKARAESEDRAAELAKGPQEIGASHILIAYKGAMRAAPYVKRTKEEAFLLATELRERALAGEDFGELAKEYSDDRGSAADNGSLGTFRREQMVPEFSNAAFGLEVGDVSEVVESPFGYHVILRRE